MELIEDFGLVSLFRGSNDEAIVSYKGEYLTLEPSNFFKFDHSFKWNPVIVDIFEDPNSSNDGNILMLRASNGSGSSESDPLEWEALSFSSQDGYFIGAYDDQFKFRDSGGDYEYQLSGDQLGAIVGDIYLERSYKPPNKNSLIDAIDLWISNETKASSLYGDINDWDVSEISDASSLYEFNQTETTITGNANSETFESTSSNDSIDGGGGTDTVTYSGSFSNYSFTRATDALQIADQRTTGTTDGTDTLKNIEFLQFTDQTVDESKVDVTKSFTGNFSDYKFYNKGNGIYQIKTDSGYDDITGLPLLTFTGEATTSSFREISAIVDIKGTFDQVTGMNTDSGRMFRLYNASFKRLPDPDGLAYWIDNFSSGRNTIRVVASSFLGSAEFAERYGGNVSDSTYVNTLYKNVLGRDADTGGLNYWLGQLNSGAETRYEVLLGFAESAENKTLFTEMTGFG